MIVKIISTSGNVNVASPLQKHTHHELCSPYDVIHFNDERERFISANPDMPLNAVAAIEHGPADARKVIYITDDQEAYLLSDFGNTVSVIIPPKQKTTHSTMSGSKTNDNPRKFESRTVS